MITAARTAIASGLTRRQADEVVVLLAAMGIEAEADGERGASVWVDDADAERARALVAEEYPAGFPGDVPTAGPGARDGAPASAEAVWFGRGTWAIALVAAVCVAWFALLHGSGREETRSRLLDFGAITWDQVWLGEWWRLATGVLVHFDGAHLLTNLLTLVIVAPPLAHLLGPWRFLLVFALTGIAGNVVSHLFAPSAALKGGASGAVAGVLGALAGTSLDPAWGRRFKRWQVLGALAAVYALLVGAGPDRDNAGHLGGLLAGVVLGRLLSPRRAQDAAAASRTTSMTHPSSE
ncbi:MAG: rhomboid family intramembrane serine protease [Thermodesulfobacteriota bacterium]